MSTPPLAWPPRALAQPPLAVELPASPARPPAAGWTSWATAVGVVTLLGVSGCAGVKPHQRRYLSLPEMSAAGEAEEGTWQSHVEAAREAGMGGHGVAGGGCGCG